MATRGIDTTLCNSDYIVYLSAPLLLGRYLTIEDIGTNPSFFTSHSIVISTTSGYSFLGGTSSEYIRTPGGELTFATMASNWRLLNTAPFTRSGLAYLSTASTTHLYLRGSFSNTGEIRIQNILSATAIDAQTAPTIQGIPTVMGSDLVSTVGGLGTLGFLSSIPFINESLVSTVKSLGTYGYVSSTQLQSTFIGLGQTYISTPSLVSTVGGLGSLYISSPHLTSTVQGLGSFGYLSAPSLVSSVKALETIYISTSQLTSTVGGILFVTSSNSQSTFQKLGLIYVSSASLVSTVQGLSNIGYITPTQYTSTIVGLSSNSQSNVTSTSTGLGSLGYISASQLVSSVSSVLSNRDSTVSIQISSLGSLYVSSLSLQSTVAGLGSNYVSSASLYSTVGGLSASNASNLVSTYINLGTYYISTAQLVSTTTGISSVHSLRITSTTSGLGSTYISTPSLQSTIAGLGTAGYVSVSQLVSTTSSITTVPSTQIQSTLAGLGSLTYISVAQLTSTVTGTTNIYTSNLISTVNTLGQTYISSLSLQSTFAGLGSLNYISVAHLISTTIGLSNNSSNAVTGSTIAGLGSTYISSASFQSTILGITVTTSSNSPNITSTVAGLGSVGYISTPALPSTFAGLGMYYLSSGTLVSTITGLQSNVTYSQVQTMPTLVTPATLTTRIVNSLGNPYEQVADLRNTTNQILGSYTYYFDSFMVSTVYNATNGFTSVCVSVDGTSVFATKTTSIVNAGTGSTLTTLSQSIQGITCSATNFYVTASNQIIEIGISSPYTQTVIANTTNDPGFSNSSSPSSPSTASTVSFSNPTGIAIDASGTFLYICDTGNNAIRRMQINPLSVTTLASIPNPSGIAVDSSSTYAYIVCSTGNLYQLSLITSNLTLLSTTYASPMGICLDPSNTFAYITNTGSNTVIQLTLVTGSNLILGLGQGTDGAAWLKSGSQPFATFTSPSGIFYGSDGFIYIADGFVRKLLPQKYTSTLSGLYEYRKVTTIPITSSSVINTTSNQFIIASNLVSITTSPNIVISNATLYITSNIDATGYTVTAATFTASNGRSGGPNYGFYFGDGTHVTSISDRRLKEDIRPITNALDKVNSLQAVKYRLQRDPSRTWIGYIAQDVEQILPEIVRTDDSPERWKSIQYTNLPALIIQAVKELHAKYARIQSLCR